MRTTITATTLLLAATALPVLAIAPAHATASCADADTTWVAPSGGASAAWDEPTNWTDGVPTATSVVCVPATTADKAPHVADGTTASAAQVDAADSGVAIDGTLELAESMDAGFVELSGGTLAGGATTVTGPLTADGSIGDATALVSNGPATLGELDIDGSLTVNGVSSLTADASLDIDPQTGLIKISPTGTLLLDEAGSFVDVVGPLLNLGVVRAVAGTLFVVGWGHELSPGYSTGTFEADPEAELWVVRTDLGNGARVIGANASGPSTIADGATVSLDRTALMRWGSDSEDPQDEGFTGGGELVAVNGTTVGGWVGGSLELVVPEGEVLEAADLTMANDATISVMGELQQTGYLDLEDDASTHVFGVHRLVEASGGGTAGENNGTEVVEPGGLLTGESDAEIGNPLVNQGTVRADSGTLDVTDLDAASLHDGVLDGGRYVAAAGATLELPPVRVNQADLVLAGPDASFGDGLDSLNRIATDGRLELRGGVDLATEAALSNVGHVLLSPGSRLAVDGAYRQGGSGELVTQVARNGYGRLVATGRRNLAGDLVIRRIAGYRPAIGDRFVVLTSNGRRGGGFDQVQGITFAKRRFVVEYVGDDRVRLRVAKRG